MEKSIFRYIWRHSSREQLWIAFVIIASIPTYFLTLTLPKEIVNGPISEVIHDYTAGPARFMVLKLPAIEALGFGGATVFDGVSMERLPHLIALCLSMLALVVINGAFKFYINTYKGRLAERVLRRLRFELVDRVLRFPQNYLRKVRPAEISTMVNTEVEPMGGFVGEAYATPLFLLAQALTALTFILLQSVPLGIVAVVIVGLQVGIIPRMRRRLIDLAKQRQIAARQLAGRVAEIVEGSGEIRVNDGSNWERADVSRRLGEIFDIRYRFFRAKFFIKFLNNFLSQLTPFLFYLIGGYAAIKGTLDVGQLVAVIAAYRDLPPPIKELILWDQQRVDVQVKYDQVIEHFSPDNLLPPEVQAPRFEPVPRLEGALSLDAVSLGENVENAVLIDASLTQPPGGFVAIVGDDMRALEAFGEALARLSPPLEGRIQVGDQDLSSLSDTIAGKRVAYLGPSVYYANSTLEDALLYSIRNLPSSPDGEGGAPGRFNAEEARLSGNLAIDPEGNWLDLGAAGAADLDELNARILSVLDAAGLYEDVFEFGLGARIDPEEAPDLALKVVQARAVLRFWIEEEIHDDLVEPFDAERYSVEASVATNLVFGAARTDGAMEDFLIEPGTVAAFEAAGIAERLLDMGERIARTLAELIEAAGDDSGLMRSVALIGTDEIAVFRASGPIGRWRDDDAGGRAMLLRFALRYIEPRDRLGLLDEDFRAAVVAARETLRARMTDAMAGRFSFYEIDDYTPGATILENILFGKIRLEAANGRERIRKIILEMIAELEMQDGVVTAGLTAEVGSGGRALTTAQRQKLGLARALLKRPDILVLNRAFDTLGNQAERRLLGGLLDAAREPDRPPMTVIAILTNPALSSLFDRAIVVRGRRIVEDGDPGVLIRDATSALSAISREIGGDDDAGKADPPPATGVTDVSA